MKPIHNQFVIAILVLATIIGCNDKDRQMARRTSDGSDTFKYEPPPAQTTPRPVSNLNAGAPTKNSLPNIEPDEKNRAQKPAAQAPSTSAKPASRNDAESFKYRPDPKLLKQLSHPNGK